MIVMKLAVVACSLALVAGCIPPPHEITATSYASLPQSASEVEVSGTILQAQQALVEKLANRGFPLVDRKPTTTGVWLKFGGNRDFAGTDTIGSVFYIWVDPSDAAVGNTRIRMVGKPTLDHNEGCPSMDGEACKPLTTYQVWGITGYEEAVVIHGVFSALALDGVVPAQTESRTATR